MSRLSAFETYSLYLALRNHFTRDSYDFFRYHGKTNATMDAFLNRKDRFQFQKLSRKHSADDMMLFLVSNIIKGKSWVGDFLEDDADENFLSFNKTNQSLSYTFKSELDKLFTASPPHKAFKSMPSTYPTAMMLYLSGVLSIQTMVILNSLIGFANKWDITYKDDPIWSKQRMMINKFSPFLEFDRKKFSTILSEKIREYTDDEGQQARYSQGSEAKKVA